MVPDFITKWLGKFVLSLCRCFPLYLSLSLVLSFHLSLYQFFFPLCPHMQIPALLFKELSTHNPMDDSIFRVLHTHTHSKTHTGVHRQANASHTLLGIQRRMQSHINIHTNWHTRTHTHTQSSKLPPLRHGCYILCSERFKLPLAHKNFKTSRLSPAAMQPSIG